MAIDTSLAGLEPLVNFRQDYLQNQRQQEVLELQRQELRQRQQEQAQLLALRQAAERREQAESNQRAAVAARRFLGLRNFQADVASGINSSEALDKHKADLFFGDPDAQVNFERVKEIERHNREMEKISSRRVEVPSTGQERLLNRLEGLQQALPEAPDQETDTRIRRQISNIERALRLDKEEEVEPGLTPERNLLTGEVIPGVYRDKAGKVTKVPVPKAKVETEAERILREANERKNASAAPAAPVTAPSAKPDWFDRFKAWQNRNR